MKLKALIVDDEYPARQELRYALSKIDNVEVVGEAANAQEALTLIKALDYSVLFLDIAMPGINGLELGAAIQELDRPPHVIYVTAYDEYAVKAFDVNAVDYVLKPIDEKRLRQAVNKVLKLSQENGAKTETRAEPTIRIDRLPAEKNGKVVLVNEGDIVYAFTEGDAVFLKTYADKFLAHFTLKELEARLNPNVFFRTHRCFIVNLHKVKEIIPFFNSTYSLVVEDKERSEVPLSRSQAKRLRRILGF
ncbi:MAG: LytTR family DNA-binding domain-containing protein [Thermoanaerobacteraceae bacterium]|nr:LytTR family DNA-binding domain-containing protein [Thermoanaerobacteraceae bacterium]